MTVTGAGSMSRKHRHFPKIMSIAPGRPVFAVGPAGCRRVRWAMWISRATTENFEEAAAPDVIDFGSDEAEACTKVLAIAPTATRISNWYATPLFLDNERRPGAREIRSEIDRAKWAATGADARDVAERWGLPKDAWSRAFERNSERREQLSALDWFELILAEARRATAPPEVDDFTELLERSVAQAKSSRRPGLRLIPGGAR